MVYTKNTWVDDDPTKPLSAGRMAHLETQYDEAIANDKFIVVAPSVLSYGAVGDGVTDDSVPIAAAATANNVVMYSKPTNPGAAYNFYSSSNGTYTNALGTRYMAGLSGQPVADAKPIIWVQKHSSATRTGAGATNTSEWDQGAVYGADIKESGDAYSVGITGYVRHQSADGGQSIGVHGRGSGYHANSQVWGGWSYAYAPDLGSGAVAASIIGHEINLNNRGDDQGWQIGGTVGQSRGLVVVTADSSNPVTHGIYVGNNSAAPLGKMHTGMIFKGDGIVPSDAAVSSTSVANNEALRFEGASTVGNDYTGIRMRSGYFRTGVSLAESTYDNNSAILLGDGHSIVVGAGPSSSSYLNFNKTSATANFQNFQIAINGTKLLGTQKTGWSAPTGTMLRTAFVSDTVTLPQLAARVAALEIDLLNHGMIGA